MSWKRRNWCQNEVDEEIKIKGVDSIESVMLHNVSNRDMVKHNGRSDQ